MNLKPLSSKNTHAIERLGFSEVYPFVVDYSFLHKCDGIKINFIL